MFDKVLDIRKCWLQPDPSNDIRMETKRFCVENGAKKRFSSQHTMEFFKAHSDFVIENNGSVNDTFQKTCEVIETIKERYNGG